jgi:hypothetical protein
MTCGLRTRVVVTVMIAALMVSPTGASARGDQPLRRLVLTARAARSGRGRPRKFTRPARAVTLTLPDDVIAALRTVDTDLSRAVVRTVQPLLAATPSPATELVVYGNRAVIVVPRNRELRDRAGVELIPLSDGRALISFDDRLTTSRLELALEDALADPALVGQDRETFEALASILRSARRTGKPSLQQRNIIVLRWPRRRRTLDRHADDDVA